MKVQVIRSRFVPGRVLIGPKAVGDSYYRIVSQHDRSGRIEAFDPQSRSWTVAPEDVTFNEVWSAPSAPQWSLDLAAAPPSDFGDEAVAEVAGEENGHFERGPDFPEDASILEHR